LNSTKKGVYLLPVGGLNRIGDQSVSSRTKKKKKSKIEVQDSEGLEGGRKEVEVTVPRRGTR